MRNRNPSPNDKVARNASAEGEETVVKGSVESIVFRNEENGYTVLTVRLPGVSARDVRVVGNCLAVWEGEEVVARGQWGLHPVHGRRFQAESIVCVAPGSPEGVCRYLGSGMIRGIGKVNAKRIVDRFGMNTLDIIDKESRRLEEVEGIGPVRRRRIKTSWDEQRGVRDIMIFLQSHGVGTAQAARIYRQYGTDAVALVKQNPYRLCDDVWGIGFKSADAIAERVGIARESEQRARAGLRYLLNLAAEEGHCFLLMPELLLHAGELLGIAVEILAEALEKEVAEEKLVREEDRVYLRVLYEAETDVATRLRKLMDAAPGFRPILAEPAVDWAQERMDITLAPTQRQALITSLESKVSVITGGPGVGKTTIIRALSRVFRARGLRLLMAAPTGRASRRMSEATGLDAQTLHRLLRFNPRQRCFEHNAETPLEADCVILDEVSMIDIQLMDHFLRAVPSGAVLIMVGDTDQLPSVGPGNVLRDIIASGAVPCRELTLIFRQDVSGLIVHNAHRVNSGDFPVNGDRDSDFFLIPGEDPDRMIEQMIELVARRIPRRFGFDPKRDIQVLTPMRRNRLGSENLNILLQRALNPEGPALTRFGAVYRTGDRVMQLRNNYDKDVFNGDIGVIETVDTEENTLRVDFDGVRVEYDLAELDELSLAYACSIHKSQGSEYPAVLVLLATQHFKLLQRNLLYTAITRGRDLVCLLGSPKAVWIALRNHSVRERRTQLSRRLRSGEGSRKDPPLPRRPGSALPPRSAKPGSGR